MEERKLVPSKWTTNTHLDSMYVGFSAATDTNGLYQHILEWSFNKTGRAQNLDISRLPPLQFPTTLNPVVRRRDMKNGKENTVLKRISYKNLYAEDKTRPVYAEDQMELVLKLGLFCSFRNPQTTKLVGTFGYMAPDLMRTGKATTCTDVYAFGIFRLEVACGKRPNNKGWLKGEIWFIGSLVAGKYLDGDAVLPNKQSASTIINLFSANDEAPDNEMPFPSLFEIGYVATIDSILVAGR
ncbi:hypothetical protein Pint_32779 [Pistacia integerrima]|uniref:Uncharacterized protein n=1 Tax=Pistacia integerrima TaxID=434235 RepID=A0ACC0XT77_9ROSI|nr:hypothetical protein Pint_32779 [Pistacia integerrima]